MVVVAHVVARCSDTTTRQASTSEASTSKASTSAGAGRATAKLPLPSECIRRVFELGRFSARRLSKLARVSNDATWQECVQGALWRELEVSVCGDLPLRSLGLVPERRLYVHKLKTQNKVKAALQQPDKAKYVKELRIRVAGRCKQSKCRRRHEVATFLQASDAALDYFELTLNCRLESFVPRFLIELLIPREPLAFALYVNSTESLAPRLSHVERGVVRHWAAPRSQRLAVSGPERQREPKLTPSTAIFSWATMLPHPKRLSCVALASATALTLHGDELSLKRFGVLTYVISLDITLALALVGQLSTKGPMMHLLPSLRHLTIRLFPSSLDGRKLMYALRSAFTGSDFGGIETLRVTYGRGDEQWASHMLYGVALDYAMLGQVIANKQTQLRSIHLPRVLTRGAQDREAVLAEIRAKFDLWLAAGTARTLVIEGE